MAGFDTAAADAYDDRIIRVMPGYATLIELTAATCAAAFPDHGNILVVGAGTGSELVRLAQANPTWLFTAVDPSIDMLNVARKKVDAAGVADRVSFDACAIQAFNSDIQYDGVTSILVGHFIPDDGGRLAFYRSIANAMAKGASLVCVETTAAANHCMIENAYFQWGVLAGAPKERAREITDTVKVHHIGLEFERFTELFDEVGLQTPVEFFRAFGFGGFIATKV